MCTARLMVSIALVGCRSEPSPLKRDPGDITSASTAPAALVDGGASLSCPDGMALILGDHDLPSFCLDRLETTVDEYQSCKKAGACGPVLEHAPNARDECTMGAQGHERHPITCTSFDDASKYCAWRGRRLPSGSEWRWAAHGGARKTRFPWGNDEPLKGEVCLWRWASPDTRSCVVGAKHQDVSPDGVTDLFANASEWVAGAPPLAGESGATACAASCCRAGADGGCDLDLAESTFNKPRPFLESCSKQASWHAGIRCAANPVVK